MELANKYKVLLNNNGINTPLRLAHFFAQLDHESGLKPIAENLNYSSKGLRATFGKYFTELEAIKYQRKPEMIANRVYANRMGNGDEASGDGWKYRGRGFIQITGFDNYHKLSLDNGMDFLEDPELLLTEQYAMISAIWFWNKNNLNKYADQDNIKEVTRRINGGYNGLEHRTALLSKYKTEFNV